MFKRSPTKPRIAQYVAWGTAQFPNNTSFGKYSIWKDLYFPDTREPHSEINGGCDTYTCEVIPPYQIYANR